MAYAPTAPEGMIEAQFVDVEGRIIEGRTLRFTYQQFRENLMSRLHDCRSVKPGHENDRAMIRYRENFESNCLAAARIGAVDPNDALRWIRLSTVPYPPEERARLAREDAIEVGVIAELGGRRARRSQPKPEEPKGETVAPTETSA